MGRSRTASRRPSQLRCFPHECLRRFMCLSSHACQPRTTPVDTWCTVPVRLPGSSRHPKFQTFIAFGAHPSLLCIHTHRKSPKRAPLPASPPAQPTPPQSQSRNSQQRIHTSHPARLQAVTMSPLAPDTGRYLPSTRALSTRSCRARRFSAMAISSSGLMPVMRTSINCECKDVCVYVTEHKDKLAQRQCMRCRKATVCSVYVYVC